MGPGNPCLTLDKGSRRSREQLLQALRAKIARLQRTRRPAHSKPISTGCGGLDRLLPEGGFCRGTLVEWLVAGEGSGAQTLALIAARQACRDGRVLVVLDDVQKFCFYPPAALRLGIASERLIVVRAAKTADTLWAFDQALRCPAVGAALVWLRRLESRTFRRLQLAAEQGGTLGLLIRPESARHEPSWASVRLRVEPLPLADSIARRRLRIQGLPSRGGTCTRSVEVEIDDETNTVHLAAPLAEAKARTGWLGA